MQIYESAVLRRDSFPCRPATVGVILAAPSWLKQAERRVDHVQAQDAGADARRSAWMAAAQAGDGTAYQALLRDCIPIIKVSRDGAVYRPIMSTMWCRTHC